MLYKELAARSFADTIDAEKVTYKLPTGEYNYEGNKTKDQVLAAGEGCGCTCFEKLFYSRYRVEWPRVFQFKKG